MNDRPTPRERWNSKYSDGPGSTAPSPFLNDIGHLLPSVGNAADLAGGSGRNAIWLAQTGLETTLVEVSDVALSHAAAAAKAAGVSLHLVDHDLESSGIPDGPWDVIVIHLFLDWTVLDAVAQHLAPGGRLVFMQPTTTNLERHPSPSARFLVEPGQLATWLETQPLDVLFHTEQWEDTTNRHEARLVAQLRVL